MNNSKKMKSWSQVIAAHIQCLVATGSDKDCIDPFNFSAHHIIQAKTGVTGFQVCELLGA